MDSIRGGGPGDLRDSPVIKRQDLSFLGLLFFQLPGLWNINEEDIASQTQNDQSQDERYSNGIDHVTDFAAFSKQIDR